MKLINLLNIVRRVEMKENDYCKKHFRNFQKSLDGDYFCPECWYTNE